ncbi:MAG: C1 family peptidase, partial [Steroidobacteraceae bacterium]|nr:C1 family peptidase [Steroidobacteraceae bacterium]MDW8258630.1 C1 family peptidase [Gammaproteobacteria bacterium]
MPTKFVAALDRTLDARPDRLDLRDREFTPLVSSLPDRYPDDRTLSKLLPRYARAGLILDQGPEGACTGFGLAAVINYLLYQRTLLAGARRVESVSVRMLYHLARFYDEWAGEDYEGSSCRGALKAWHKHGVCRDTLWPYRDESGRVTFIRPRNDWAEDALQRTLGVYYRINRASVVDIQAALLQVGAVYVSCDVHDGWEERALIRPRGRRASTLRRHKDLATIGRLRDRRTLGGHAFALIGFNPCGFVVQNSWGQRWGTLGFAVLPYEEWVERGSDAWVCALGVPADLAARKAVPRTFRGGGQRLAALPAAGVALAARSDAPPSGLPQHLQPLPDETAYQHTLVWGNDGRFINRIVTARDAADAVHELVVHAPAQWFATERRPVPRIAIYAHGGLNSEAQSLRRIAVLAPHFLANGIYPLFLSWKTGPLETLCHLIEDQLQRIPRPEGGIWDRFKEAMANALDRSIEVAARPVLKP